MAAEIAQILAADSQEIPFCVERQLGRDAEVATLVIAEKDPRCARRSI